MFEFDSLLSIVLYFSIDFYLKALNTGFLVIRDSLNELNYEL